NRTNPISDASGGGDSNPLRVEHRLLAGAVAAQRALIADRVRPLEDPVLPGGEACEDFRFHGLGSAEPQVRFETGERVCRKTRALLEEDADLVLPVDVVEREGDEAERFRLFRVERLSDRLVGGVERLLLAEETGGEPRAAV